MLGRHNNNHPQDNHTCKFIEYQHAAAPAVGDPNKSALKSFSMKFLLKLSNKVVLSDWFQGWRNR